MVELRFMKLSATLSSVVRGLASQVVRGTQRGLGTMWAVGSGR